MHKILSTPMRALLIGVSAAALSITALAACDNDPGPPPVPGNSVIPTRGTLPQESWSVVEMAALNALDHDPRQKGARYEADGNRIVVTIYIEGKPLSASELAEYTELVRRAVPGHHIVIETTNEDPPKEAD